MIVNCLDEFLKELKLFSDNYIKIPADDVASRAELADDLVQFIDDNITQEGNRR